MANSGGVSGGTAQKPVRARGKTGDGEHKQTTTSRGGNGKEIRAPSLGKPIVEQPTKARVRSRRTMGRNGERTAEGVAIEQAAPGQLVDATQPTADARVLEQPTAPAPVDIVSEQPARVPLEARIAGLEGLDVHASRDAVYTGFEFLSSGSCGVAYTATAQDGSRVLVKELHEKYIKGMDVDALRRMGETVMSEGKTLRALAHQAIPAYVDMYAAAYNGETRFYLVQEFKEGKTVAEHVKDGTLFAEKDAASIAEQLLEVLKYLQTFSPPVLHRDITPNNVKLLRQEDGTWRVSLIDFGIARTEVAGTLGGTILGTRGYAAPEQFLEGKASPASENYSVAATLLKLLTRIDVDKLAVDKQGIPQFKDKANVTPAFAAWLERMLDQDASRRPQTAEAALVALKNQTVVLAELTTREDVVEVLKAIGYTAGQIEKALGKSIIANATAAQQVDLLVGTVEERAKKMYGGMFEMWTFLHDLKTRDTHKSLPTQIKLEVTLQGYGPARILVIWDGTLPGDNVGRVMSVWDEQLDKAESEGSKDVMRCRSSSVGFATHEKSEFWGIKKTSELHAVQLGFGTTSYIKGGGVVVETSYQPFPSQYFGSALVKELASPIDEAANAPKLWL